MYFYLKKVWCGWKVGCFLQHFLGVSRRPIRNAAAAPPPPRRSFGELFCVGAAAAAARESDGLTAVDSFFLNGQPVIQSCGSRVGFCAADDDIVVVE